MLPPPRRFETACRADAITGGPNCSGDLLLPHLGGKGGQQRHEVLSNADAANQRFAAIAQRRQEHGDHAVTD